ncbi:MAG: hypothetical protein V2I46_14295 [Bacteroides sp.]|jgi:V/A-type H+-transporting ATPase subunit E|nr:hypothetical protein [Bacteroides sp.]
MQTKLQELTEKIYQEGVNKANEEAEKILSDAKKKAEELVSKAHKEADDIVKIAEKDASTLQQNSLNELKLAGRQAISDLKQKIAGLVEARVIQPETKGAFKDIAFTQELIQTIVKNWNPKDSENVSLNLLLPSDKQKDFEVFFKEKAKGLFDKGLEVNYSDRMKTGFKIGPKEGGYLISFADEDFENFFKAFLRPRLIEMLYGEKE